MKILTWNCNGALRKKFDSLKIFQADIIVVQECENPAAVKDPEYCEWASKFLWIGDNQHKGLGIFVSKETKIEKLNWKSGSLKYFIPCRINDDLNFLGAWCYGGDSLKDYRYIGQLWKYLQLHKRKLDKSIIAGDFNSNVFWDQPRRNWNHSDVVRELGTLGIKSLYHEFYKEDQGKESRPTFIFQKNTSKPYHIDYVFASDDLGSRLKTVSVGQPDQWLELSDHMPVLCEF